MEDTPPDFNFEFSDEELLALSQNILNALNMMQIGQIKVEEIQVLPSSVIDLIDFESIAMHSFGLTDPLGQLQSWLSSMFSWVVSTLWGWIKPFIEPILPFIDWVKGGISNLLQSVSNLANSINRVIVQPIADILSRIPTYLTQISTSVQQIIGSVSSSIGSIVNNVSSTLINLSQSLSSTISNITSSLSSAVGNLLRSISDIQQRLASIITNIQQSLSGVINTLSEMSRTLTSTLTQAYQSVQGMLSSLPSIMDVLSKVPQVIGEALSKIGNLADLGSTLESLINRFMDAISNLPNMVDNLVNKIADVFTMIDKTLGITSTIQSIITSISNVFQQLPSLASNIVNAIMQASQILGSMFSNFTAFIGLLKDAWNILSGLLSDVTKFLSGIAAAAWAAIPDQIKNFLSLLQSNMAAFFADPFGWVAQNWNNFVNSLPDQIKNFLKDPVGVIWGWLSTNWDNFVNSLPEPFRSFLRDPFNFISNALKSASIEFSDFMKDPLGYLGRKWNDFVNSLPDPVKSFLKDPIGVTWRWLSTNWDGFVNSLPDPIKSFLKDPTGVTWRWLSTNWNNFVESLPDPFRSFLKDPKVFLGTAIDTFGRMMFPILWDLMKDPKKLVTASSTMKWVVKNIPLPFGWIYGFLYSWLPESEEDLEKLSKDPMTYITSKYMDYIKSIGHEGLEFLENPIEYLSSRISASFDLWSWVSGALSKLWDTFNENVVQPIYHKLSEFGNWLWNGIVNLCTIIWNAVAGASSKILDAIKLGFQSFITAILNPVSSFTALVFQAAGGIATTALNAIGQTVVTPISNFFGKFAKTILDGIQKTLSEDTDKLMQGQIDPIDFYIRKIPDFLTLLLGTAIIIKLIKDSAEMLDTLRLRLDLTLSPLGIGIGSGWNIRINLGKMLNSIISLIHERINDILMAVIFWNIYKFLDGMSGFMNIGIRKMLGFGILANIPLGMTPPSLVVDSIQRLAYDPVSLTYIRSSLEANGYPYFIIDAFWNPAKGYHVNWFPKYSKLFDEAYKEAINGYITLIDRFGKERKIPTFMIYELPSTTDIIRMMIRDLFFGAEETAGSALQKFIKFTLIKGLTPDIAYMYYLFHFKYPPPEKLWDFTVRGISGLLWYTPTQRDRAIAEQESAELGAGKPVSPLELNMQHSKLISAFSSYMKWHDYGRHAWIDGFTSDNWLVIDTLADIPTKIDQRWMVRWALYDLIAEKAKEFTKPIRDIISSLLESAPSSQKIIMDLSHFCRTLQATGLHPDWVPIVAVAESINALADERTLVRTGFINLYERGFLDLNFLENLLSGFFVSSFKVAWFDMKNLQWKTDQYINVPVMFLPAERQFLKLRAVFDRAELLLRELMSFIWWSIRLYVHFPTQYDLNLFEESYGKYLKEYESIVESKLSEAGASSQTIDLVKSLFKMIERYKYTRINNIVTEFVDELNKTFFTPAIKDITGKELRLVVDEPWIQLYERLVSYLRNAEGVDRSRYYARYFIWRALGRFERGFIGLDDIAEWVHRVIGLMRETPVAEMLLMESATLLYDGFIRETKAKAILSLLSRRVITMNEALKRLEDLGISEEVSKALVEAYARPYVPAPVTYATMLEVVPEAAEIADKMVEIFGFPEDERKFWQIYFKRKPYADEMTLLRTRIFNLLGAGVPLNSILEVLKDESKIPEIESIYERNKDVWNKFGIILDELKMYHYLGRLNSMLAAVRGDEETYVPSLSTIATLIEYTDAVKSKIPEVLKMRNIPQDWAEIWNSYYTARELANDVDRLLSQYLRLIEITTPSESLKANVEKLLRMVGYSDSELEILNMVTDIRVQVRSFNYVVPTVRGLLTDCAYIYDYKPIVESVFNLRKLPKEWMNYYLNLIRNRKAYRNVGRYITELITSYQYGVIDDAFILYELNSLKTFGLSDDEISLIMKTARLRRLRYEVTHAGESI